MDAGLQAKFKPVEAQPGKDFSDAKISTLKDAAAIDSNAEQNKASFRNMLMNANDDIAKQRAAQKNGDNLKMAKSDEEFAKMLADKANAANQRKPQNELDKNAFLKLFVTQMRNQDPMNPDNSSQMAAQLAQFHGLEQMMNVNKNLEKMQADDATARAVSLIGFVGKDIRLDNGKLQLAGGRIATDATVNLAADATKTTMEVRDSAGVIVTSMDMGPAPAGDHKIEWDGLNKDGKKVPDGSYTFSLTATGQQGEPIDAKITSNVRVTGVDLHDNGGSFYTALGKVRIGEVASVGDSGFVKGQQAAAAAAAAAAAKKGDGEQRPPEEAAVQAAEAAAGAVSAAHPAQHAEAAAPASGAGASAQDPSKPQVTPADIAAMKAQIQAAMAAEPAATVGAANRMAGPGMLPPLP